MLEKWVVKHICSEAYVYLGYEVMTDLRQMFIYLCRSMP